MQSIILSFIILSHLFMIYAKKSNLPEHQSATNCGKEHRACAHDAECVKGKCRCKSNLFGSALTICHRLDQYQCSVEADPHFISYGNAKARLNFPCRYRLTRIQTPLKEATSKLSFCSFEVFGYNEIRSGRFFTSGLEISLAVVDMANQFFKHKDYLKFELEKDGIVSSDGGIVQYGTGVHKLFKNISIICTYDKIQRFATLDIPRCGFHASFRPFDDSIKTGPQSMIPAIVITVDHGTFFGRGGTKSKYPRSLCGVGPDDVHEAGDDAQLYNMRSLKLGITSDRNKAQPHVALFFDALNENLSQISILGRNVTDNVLRNSDMCQNLVTSFSNCNMKEKIDTAKLCHETVNQRHQVECLGADNVLTALYGCVFAKCKDKAIGCDIFNNAFTNKMCKKPKQISTFCG